jgi:hypothetical protein
MSVKCCRREDAICAAIEIGQFAIRVDAQASGIRNPRVAAKDTEWVTVKIEGKGRSVTVAVWRRRTRHDNALFAHKRPTDNSAFEIECSPLGRNMPTV